MVYMLKKIKKGELIPQDKIIKIDVDLAFIIKNGEKKNVIRNINLIFDIKKFTMGIKQIGQNLNFCSFMCNASSGWIPVTFGMPSVMIKME